MKKFPYYLGVGVIATFTIYFVSVLYDTLQLLSPSPNADLLLAGFFLAGTFSFFLVGGSAIITIYTSIKKEFDDITTKQKELGLNDFGKGTDSVSIKTNRLDNES